MATSESQKPSFSSSSKPNDIFLSFNGSDTGKMFTDHLYHALMREGFQTFRVDDEIKRGDASNPELQEAIRNSRMSVIVLSENSANSTACLFELQTIVELCKKSDHFVLPVFHKVEPSVLRKQSKNLVFKKEEVTVEKVKGWSAALKEVASIAGMVFRKESDGYEAKFIEQIVHVLKGKLACEHQSVDNHLVGMDSRTEYVNCWLKDRLTGVSILLICGMGGIGKTTIAKVVYNSNHHIYDAACFLENVSGVSQGHNGLVELQRHLLSDILGKNERINNVDDGCGWIKYALSKKRVLLVLDDVNRMEQLFALAGQQSWYSQGSRIIITTRLQTVMKNVDEICDVYWPEKLSNDESLELFSWHAFGQKHPIEGHMELSKMFVQHCDGLPLALKVFGSSVRWEDTDVWKSKLQKLEAISDNTILEKLEISLDSLNDDTNLFLDIACFFAGKKINEMMTILGRFDYDALAGIHHLVDRNLLTIVNGKLQMHQLLLDMGKQIVFREFLYPKRCSRIWHPKESFNILQEKIGTKNIEGLALDMNMSRNSNMVDFEANTFEKMYNLRLLKMTGVNLSGTYMAFSQRLQWLYWHGFHSDSFSNELHLENLVSLDMSCSNFNLWTGSKVLGSLKILNLSHCSKLEKTPDFSRFPNLEKLVLKSCPSLFKVDESIAELRRIQLLNVQDCTTLTKLPKNIGMVESLVEIDISGCSNLMGAIEELEKMKSLQVLKATGMDVNRVLTVEVESQASIWPWVPKPRVQMSLASLPSSLVRLDLSYCNLTEDAFPRDLSKLSKLEGLNLSGNPFSSLPNFIKDLTGLQILELSRCPKLQQIQWSSTSLEWLTVSSCDALKKITFETESCNIRTIDHMYCPNLNHIEGKFKISPIGEVDVELLDSIGFFNLDSIVDVEAKTFNFHSGEYPYFPSPIKIVNEGNLFYTFFPGREVPHWFSKKNSGSTVSFTSTLSPHFGFRGLNLCAVYRLPDDEEYFSRDFYFEINNKSSGMKTVGRIYFCGILENCGEMVWLSHCSQANLFKAGDEVEVSFMITRGGQIDQGAGFICDGQIKECGVHLLYFEDEEQKSQYLSTIHRSWDPTLSLYVPEAGFPKPDEQNLYAPDPRSRGEEDLERLQLQVHQYSEPTIGISGHGSTSGNAPEEGGSSMGESVDRVGEVEDEEFLNMELLNIEVTQSLYEEPLEKILLGELEETPSDPIELEELNCDPLEVPPTISRHELDLSHRQINSLPLYVFRLVALKKLYLRSCELLMELPGEIGELTNLEVLDLEGTEMLCLPQEIAKLVNLTCLKVSFYGYANQTVIPRTVLSNLSHLKELIIDVTPYGGWWDAEVEAIIDDLCSLKELTTLKLSLPTAELFKNLTIFRLLANFRFTVGRQEEHFISRLPREVEEEFNNREKLDKGLKYINGSCIPNEISEVFKHANAFFLQRHWTAKSLSEFGHKNMNEVKYCLVMECNELQTIIDSEQFYQGKDEAIVLGSLEKLIIRYMKNMESVWKGPVGKGSFSNLKSLALHTCPNLTTLFTIDIFRNLLNLEELIVEDCPKIDSLVSLKSSDPKFGIFLPKLKKISLLELPKLLNISSGLCIAPDLERMVIFCCPKLEKLSNMDVSSTKLKVIKGEKEWWDALMWFESNLSTEHEDYLARLFIPLRWDRDLMAQLTKD